MINSQLEGLSINRMTRRGLLVALAAGVTGVLVVGCSGGTSTAAPASGSSQSGGSSSSSGEASTVVKMGDDMKYNPETITVAKGATVEWQNTGTSPHTVTCDPSKAVNKANVALPSGAQAFDSGMLNAGATWKHTFDVAGDYTYFCIPHESMGMVGHVKVTG